MRTDYYVDRNGKLFRDYDHVETRWYALRVVTDGKGLIRRMHIQWLIPKWKNGRAIGGWTGDPVPQRWLRIDIQRYHPDYRMDEGL